MEKCFNKLTEYFFILVSLPLYKNEINRGTVGGDLCDNSWWLLSLDCCCGDLHRRCLRNIFLLWREVFKEYISFVEGGGYLPFFIIIIIFIMF